MVAALSPAAFAKLDQPGSVAYPFIIQQITGPVRQVTLRGRSNPFQGYRLEGEQRMEVKWYPGNPVGTAQVMGLRHLPTTIQGRWSDAFLIDDQNKADLHNFPAVAPAARPGSLSTGGPTFQSPAAIPFGEARRARALRDAMYKMLKEGQVVRVEWASIARYGVIENFTSDHDREEDIRWEMSFRWIGDTDAQPRPRLLPDLDPLGLLARLSAALRALLNRLNQALLLALGAVQAVQQGIISIGNLIQGFINTIQGFISLLFVPSDTLGLIKQQLTGIRLAANDLRDLVRQLPASQIVTLAGGTPLDVNAAIQASLQAIGGLLEMAQRAADGLNEISQFESPEILGFFTATGIETLRDVSTRFYGSPDNWTLIKDYNQLVSSALAEGARIRIPRLDGTGV